MKKYYLFFDEGSKINQIICAVLINLPVFAYGASIGWMSPMILLLQSKDTPTPKPLTNTEVSWMAAVAYMICVPGDYLMAFLGDRIGRKKAIIFTSSCAVCLWVTKLSSYEIWAFILARAFVGLPMAGCYVVCPMYTKEISEDSVRGVLGTLVILFHTFGNLFLYIIGDILSYRTILWICLAIPTFHLIIFMMMPESPSYLIKKGKHEEAVRVMAWLRCRNEDDPIVKKEIEVLKKEHESDNESSKFVLKAIFSDKILFRAFKIAMVVSLGRELCGAIPVLNFAGDIFAKAGTKLVFTPNQQAMVLGTIQVGGSLLGSSLVEKTGRKRLLYVTALLSGVSMFTLGAWYLVKNYDVDAPDWIPIATLCICIFCDSAGLQPMSVVIIGEILSFKYRGTVMATAMAASSLLDFVEMLFFKPLAAAVGPYLAFFFFGFVCITVAVYVILVVPETKARSLMEIHEDLKTKKEKQAEKSKNSTAEFVAGKTVEEGFGDVRF